MSVQSCGSGSGGTGSGSGNGVKVVRQKSKVGSGNNTGSNDGSDDNSSGLNVRGGSDNGSGTQVSVSYRFCYLHSVHLLESFGKVSMHIAQPT